MIEQISKTNSRWRKRPYFLFLAIISLSLLMACKSSLKTPPVSSDTTNLNQKIAKPSESNLEKANKSSNKAATVDFQGKKAIISMPISKQIHVSPKYEHPKLSLNFSPVIPKFEPPKLNNNPIVDEISLTKAPKKDHLQSVTFSLKQKVQFLVSKPSSNQLKLMLIPREATVVRKANKKENNTNPKTNRNKPDIKLTDIEFSQPNQKKLYIKLLANGPIDYDLQPVKEKLIQINLPNLSVPQEKVKLYNLQEFDTPVKNLLIQNSPQGGKLRMQLTQRAPINISVQDKSLILALSTSLTHNSNSSSPKKEIPQVSTANSSPKSTSSYEDLDLQNEDSTLLPGMKESYTGKHISLDLQDADIEHVLRLIIEVSGYSLVLDEKVSGKISLKLEDVPWDQALDLILLQKGLGMVKQGNILRITTAEQIQKEKSRIIEARKAALKAQKSRQELAPLLTEYIQINYTKAADLKSQVEKFLSERGQVSCDKRTNQLIISDTQKNIQKIKSVVQKLDRAERQVLIEARLVYATDQFQRSLGLKWGGGFEQIDSNHIRGLYGTTGDLNVKSSVGNSGFAVNLPQEGEATFGLGGFISKLTGSDLYTLDAQLTLGESQGEVKTISSPRVLTHNNQRAVVEQGTMIATVVFDEAGNPHTEYVPATLKLSVQPQITPDNKIILDLDITDDSPIPGSSEEGGGSENIEKRSINTQLLVDNKETVVIGGVQLLRQTNSQRRVPIASDMPVLGWLFKNKYRKREKRELLIFIRPKIL